MKNQIRSSVLSLFVLTLFVTAAFPKTSYSQRVVENITFSDGTTGVCRVTSRAIYVDRFGVGEPYTTAYAVTEIVFDPGYGFMHIGPETMVLVGFQGEILSGAIKVNNNWLTFR